MNRHTTRALAGSAIALAMGLVHGGMPRAQSTAALRVDVNDIGGTVTSTKGPEAGVWVIAETTELPTGFRKIVVTDDRGRYLVPDLPKANYKVWVRGYGLVDSPRVNGALGRITNLAAVVAPNPRAAAEVYPAVYWYSMVKVPAANEFPGKNGIAEGMKTQGDWIHQMKSGCVQCHQLGTKATREVPALFGGGSSTAAWDKRIQISQVGATMTSTMSSFGRQRALQMFADWSDRIAAGAVPPPPPRPEGAERDVVISQWDWADPLAFVHDVTSTDRRNPTLNAYGLVFANDRLNEPNVLTLDPVRNIVTKSVTVPLRDKDAPPNPAQSVAGPSPYWGDELIWSSRSNMHNQMFDATGRVWMTSVIRASKNPAFCQAGSSHASAKAYPLAGSSRQASVYNPKDRSWKTIDLCFGTHHLTFGEDADNTLWFSGSGQVVGWFNTKVFDQTGDAEKAQGWSPFIVDTNGNGRRDQYTEPDQPIDSAKDRRLGGRSGGAYESGFGLGFYGVTVNPVDASIWGAITDMPGRLIRFDLKSGLSEVYEPPFEDSRAPVQGFTPRGVDADRSGVIWTGLQSGHLASFDRRKCKVMNGPDALGKHCPEGWTLHATPGPKFEGVTVTNGSADMHYFNWVDQFDTFGLGKNTPWVNGTNSDSISALLPNGRFLTVRIPYPLGFHSRGLDGRIDDAKAGWKGRGLWASYSSQAPWHTEGGKGATSKAMHIQLRTSPLDK